MEVSYIMSLYNTKKLILLLEIFTLTGKGMPCLDQDLERE